MIMFFLLSASWRTWFHSVATFLKTKTRKNSHNHMFMYGFYYLPSADLLIKGLEKININIYILKIELGAWVGSCHCAFSTNMLGNTCYFLVWKIMLW